MNIHISGKNMELTDALQQYAQDKIGGLAKFNDQIIEIRVTIEPMRDHHADAVKVAAQFHISHDALYTEEVNADAYVAIDIVKSEMERQLRDWKERHLSEHRKAYDAQRERKSAV